MQEGVQQYYNGQQYISWLLQILILQTHSQQVLSSSFQFHLFQHMQTSIPITTNPSTNQPRNLTHTDNYQIQNEEQIADNKQQLTFVHKVQVKSKLPGTRSKTIQLKPHQNKFLVYSSQEDLSKGKCKQFALNEITFTHTKDKLKPKDDVLHIDTNSGKQYSIKGENSIDVAEDIKKCQTIFKVNQQQFKQQPINDIPKQVNYVTPLLSGLNNFQKILLPHNPLIFNQIPILSTFPTQKSSLPSDFSHYPRRKFYFDPKDWKIDTIKGKIKFINQQKKKNQNKVIPWVIKQFLKTGSFMGISFPTFVMKPESILESYAKAIGAAPLLFDCTTNAVERMKKFICLIHSFSILFADMVKPFNPPLGETYQAKIANGVFYAQQINHHPPISAFIYEGKGYKISGSFELTASIGPNSATGTFIGDLKVTFDDGMIYVGRIPGGEFSGFILGDHKFEAYGGFYAYNNKKLVCSISSKDKKNFFQGYIGMLKPKQEMEFFSKIESPERFKKFPFFQRKCFQTVFSSLQMAYNHKTAFDGRDYLNLYEEKYLPFLPEEIENKSLLLKSDSRHRKDIQLTIQLMNEEAQKQKQKLEDEQRYFRKLRQKYDPTHHKSQ